ncbi:heme biosynthesis HemY N-terminal domain-containing protein [Pseudocolwellia agarivorans]|uniref:heme biosynthesis HemY N-terminal domain-containing protein n=1 Tax=Pseudocolwellia agarivorans TaxID=1911682 RepID=UPI0009849E20|nr:heme biosynthesis HemY N-terminal domain-containing protein [Pseudocolwellia agarivorans]
MKKLGVLLLIFFTFIAFAPMLIDDPGYISIAMGGMIYELTLYTAMFWILFVFLILILLFILLRGGFRFSLGTWNKLAFASKRRGVKDFEKAVAAYILEDYVQAEHLFAKSAEPAQQQRVGYLLASSAASKQALRSNTQHYLGLLDSIGNNVKNGNLESVLVTIKLHIEQDDFEKARALIDEHHKFIGHDARLLSLDIDLMLIEKRFIAAVESLVLARKQKTITEQTIKQWEETAFYGAFNQLVLEKNAEELSRYWNNLSSKVKQREVIVMAYCKVLAEQNIIQPLNKILLPVVKKGTDKAFLQQMRNLPLRSADELIAVVQKHLHKDPQNGTWLSCLAHLAVSSKQWDMAEKAFNSLVNLGEIQYDNVDLIAFAKVLQQREQFEKATQVYAKLH